MRAAAGIILAVGVISVFLRGGNVAFTWFHKQQYELSFNNGYMINTENIPTHYLSGIQFHLDWTLAYYVNASLALGALGHLFAPTTPDTGKGADIGGFFSSGVGIDPAVTATLPVCGKDLAFVAKWLYGVSVAHSLAERSTLPRS